MRLTTTLNLLHKVAVCQARYKVLVSALGIDYLKDQEISLLTILETNGINDALWALRATTQDCEKVARLMAADFAELALPEWLKYYPNDDRPRLAIQAARDFANGVINNAQRAAAESAAASAAWAAVWSAAKSAAAKSAAWSAAWSAASDASVTEFVTAASAVRTARSARAEIFKKYVTEN
jgi:hypothetical protein